jgi:hypothetical protein
VPALLALPPPAALVVPTPLPELLVLAETAEVVVPAPPTAPLEPLVLTLLVVPLVSPALAEWAALLSPAPPVPAVPESELDRAPSLLAHAVNKRKNPDARAAVRIGCMTSSP